MRGRAYRDRSTDSVRYLDCIRILPTEKTEGRKSCPFRGGEEVTKQCINLKEEHIRYCVVLLYVM